MAVILVPVAIVALLLFKTSVFILKEYERGVIFRFGRYAGTKGPGLNLIIPGVDKLVRVDQRTITMDIPTQDVITRDNVSIKVNAVLYFRVVGPSNAIIQVEDYLYATSQLAQTTLRSVCGEAELDDLLSKRDELNLRIQEIIDHQTEPWGIKVVLVEIKQIDLPQEMQRAMARQAEAERERRAKITQAEGEFQAAEKLTSAAEIMSRTPASGVQVIETQEGFLACGWIGAGRLADPRIIVRYIKRAASPPDLEGKHILITAGPTREALDPVRYVSNRSSGKMGIELAEEAFRRGANVTLIHGPLAGDVSSELLSGEIPEVKVTAITSALDLQRAVAKVVNDSVARIDVVIMAAAVADYRSEESSSEKIKRNGAGLMLELVPTPDILAELGEKFLGKINTPMLIGFALETGTKQELIQKLAKKIKDKKVDYIVGNLADDSLDKESNSVIILNKQNIITAEATGSKTEIASRILDIVREKR